MLNDIKSRTKLEIKQTNFEHNLTIVGCFIPIAPGCVRFAYGITQTVAALAIGIFAGLRDLQRGEDRDGLCKYAFSVQLPHGLVNVIVSPFEAFLWFIILPCRQLVSDHIIKDYRDIFKLAVIYRYPHERAWQTKLDSLNKQIGLLQGELLWLTKPEQDALKDKLQPKVNAIAKQVSELQSMS